jgi:cell wall-associated NlpC family hydrolase
MPRPDPPSWVAHYLGAPYVHGAREGDVASGYNCWGLFAAVQREVFGRTLAEYEGPLALRGNAAAMGAAAEALAAQFEELAPGQEREGDAILMRIAGQPIHVGVVIAPGEMLHSERGANACRESYRNSLWARRIVGFYRMTRGAP